MMPWGHLAVGYFCYTAGLHIWDRQSPADIPTLALVVGTQLPDLIDKPAAYWIGLIEGRAIGHSLLFVVPLCLLLLYITHRYSRQQIGVGFTIGALTHLLTDSVPSLFLGEYGVSYLLWPILPSPQYGVRSFSHHLQQLIATYQSLNTASLMEIAKSMFAIQILLAFIVTIIWVIDGYPGVKLFVRALTR